MIGTMEIVLIVIAILVLFGGKETSKTVKKIGKTINEFRKFKV
ncbi:twin-arginine translocase TatA/TatE family subunit [Candidatus Woesearchaeota archaeon]|nr:twin-arginine translocase TatA/TatE family subunit [Candidatus Woesearchaeota archaeon]|tara:strand:- start:784 stop:912 length:129 start_codon:yes stop_codon:yes gene_type:complete